MAIIGPRLYLLYFNSSTISYIITCRDNFNNSVFNELTLSQNLSLGFGYPNAQKTLASSYFDSYFPHESESKDSSVKSHGISGFLHFPLMTIYHNFFGKMTKVRTCMWLLEISILAFVTREVVLIGTCLFGSIKQWGLVLITFTFNLPTLIVPTQTWKGAIMVVIILIYNFLCNKCLSPL